MKKILHYFLIVVVSSSFLFFSDVYDYGDKEQQFVAMTIIDSNEDDLIEGEY